MLDPGLGFAKGAAHNWSLLRHLDEIAALGYPLLVGASRKSFLGRLLASSDGVERPVDEREHATTALSVVLAAGGGVGPAGPRRTLLPRRAAGAGGPRGRSA